MRQCPKVRSAGFTLLELLVALTVLGLLTVGLAAGVRTGLAMWRAQTARVGATAELDAGARTLRRLLSEMTMLAPQPAADAEAKPASGRADRLVFVGELPTGMGTTRLADMTLELRDGGLVLLWRPHRHEESQSPLPAPTETELIAHVRRLDLAYWLPAAPEHAAGWQAQWGGPALPELIRVRIGFPAGDPRRWPDLLAAPLLTAASSP